MKKLITLFIAALVLAACSAEDQAILADMGAKFGEGYRGSSQQSPESTQRTSSKCVQVQPTCPSATHPMCICANDYSYNCRWLCVGR